MACPSKRALLGVNTLLHNFTVGLTVLSSFFKGSEDQGIYWQDPQEKVYFTGRHWKKLLC